MKIDFKVETRTDDIADEGRCLFEGEKNSPFIQFSQDDPRGAILSRTMIIHHGVRRISNPRIEDTEMQTYVAQTGEGN